MIPTGYQQFSEDLFSDWLQNEVTLLPETQRRLRFQLDHLPEPYLRFGHGKKPFCVLFTNPGAGMEHQHRDTVLAGNSCVDPTNTYYEASRCLADFYLNNLNGAAATRNEPISHIRDEVDADCVIQFESLPFHSPKFSSDRKNRVPELAKKDPLLREYETVLSEALKKIPDPVIALSAVASNRPISKESIETRPWLRWQAQLLGVTPSKLKLKFLNDRDTCALLYQNASKGLRGFVLTMGGNTFPNADGRAILAECLRRSMK